MLWIWVPSENLMRIVAWCQRVVVVRTVGHFVALALSFAACSASLNFEVRSGASFSCWLRPAMVAW